MSKLLFLFVRNVIKIFTNVKSDFADQNLIMTGASQRLVPTELGMLFLTI